MDLSFSNGTTRAVIPPMNTVKLLEEMKNLVEFRREHFTILIWKGEMKPPFIPILEKRPVLIQSEYVREENVAYIVSGIGIVAGKKAYEYLIQLPMVLEWSDEYIPLEKQQGEMSEVLLKWIKDYNIVAVPKTEEKKNE